MGYISNSFRELGKSNIMSIQVSNALMGISAGLEVPILTMVGRRVLQSKQGIAHYVTLVAVCRVLADIPTGILTEYFDLRLLLAWSIFLQIVGCTIALMMSPGVVSLMIFSTLNGLSSGVFFLTRHIYVSRVSRREHRGMMMSFLAGILRWSHVIGPMVLGATAAIWENEQYYFIVPLVAAVIAWICVVLDSFVHPTRRGRDDAYEHNHEKRQMIGEDQSKQLLSTKTETEEMEMKALGNEEFQAVPSYEGTAIKGGETTDHTNDSGHSILNGKPHSHKCKHNIHTEPGEFRLHVLCTIIVENWTVIWRLGVYILLYISLRANRKLLLSFAAMRMNLSNSQIAFLLSLSFTFDACLFPLGGHLTDVCGCRWSMVVVVLSLGATFVLLPLSQSEVWLYVMASVMGTADALGCGLVLTLIADNAPNKFGGPFFGVMRTVQDMGHVLGALVVVLIIARVDFVFCCYVWGAVSVVAALWARFLVPLKTD